MGDVNVYLTGLYKEVKNIKTVSLKVIFYYFKRIRHYYMKIKKHLRVKNNNKKKHSTIPIISKFFHSPKKGVRISFHSISTKNLVRFAVKKVSLHE